MRIAIGSLQCEGNSLTPVYTRFEDLDYAPGESMYQKIKVMEEQHTARLAREAAEAEEAPAAEPEAEPDYKALYEAALAEIEDLQRQLADAVAANTALEAEAEQLRAVPTAQPAHEEVRAASEIRRTGNKRLDRIAELMGKF